jgi:hypothetical protein
LSNPFRHLLSAANSAPVCRPPPDQNEEGGPGGEWEGRQRETSKVWTLSYLIHYLNTYAHITATKAKPFPYGLQSDILLSGITTIDNPTAKDWHIDVQ